MEPGVWVTIDTSTDGQASIIGVDGMTVKVSLLPEAGYNAHAESLSIINVLDIYCYSLTDSVKALPYLTGNPIFDPSYHSSGKSEDLAQLARNSVHLLAGLPINGLRFTPNLAWIEWSRVSGCLSSEEEEELEINEYVNVMASEDELSSNGNKFEIMHHRSDLSQNYSTLFIGNILQECQSHLE
ncbi:hypothetical protein TSMEX_010891 [Taenia solium]|eukprot:TsM_000361500 transcript=TsM_000361500 gene=TsM_000361500